MFSTFFPLTCTPHSYCNDTYRNTISNLTSQVCLLQRCHDESWYQLRHDTIRPCHWFSMTTRCYTYLFHLQDMQSKGEAAGFHTEECEYVTVYNTNRKTGVQLRRVFVHALFRKPSWRRKKNLSLIATLESATAKRLFITSGAHCLHEELCWWRQNFRGGCAQQRLETGLPSESPSVFPLYQWHWQVFDRAERCCHCLGFSSGPSLWLRWWHCSHFKHSW